MILAVSANVMMTNPPSKYRTIVVTHGALYNIYSNGTCVVNVIKDNSALAPSMSLAYHGPSMIMTSQRGGSWLPGLCPSRWLNGEYGLLPSGCQGRQRGWNCTGYWQSFKYVVAGPPYFQHQTFWVVMMKLCTWMRSHHFMCPDHTDEIQLYQA